MRGCRDVGCRLALDQAQRLLTSCGVQEWLGRHKLDRATLQRLKDNYEGHTAWLAWQQAQEEEGGAEQPEGADPGDHAVAQGHAALGDKGAAPDGANHSAHTVAAPVASEAAGGGDEPAPGLPEMGGCGPQETPAVEVARASPEGALAGTAKAPMGAGQEQAVAAVECGDVAVRGPGEPATLASEPRDDAAGEGHPHVGGAGDGAPAAVDGCDGAAADNAAAAAPGGANKGDAEEEVEEGPEIMPERWGLWKARSRAVVPLGSEPGRFSYEFRMVHVLLEFRNALALPRRKADPASWVGRCVRVYWPDDGLWYSADVVAWRPRTGTHVLLYHADDEEEELDLVAEERQRRLQWLHGADSSSWPSPPHPPLPLGRPPTARLSNGDAHLQRPDASASVAYGARGDNGQGAERDALGDAGGGQPGKLSQVKQESGAEAWGSDGTCTGAPGGVAAGVSAGAAPAGEAAVGWRVEVFWEDGDTWCKGLVEAYEEHLNRHKVHFDDGDMQWVDCSMCPVRWLKADARQEAAEERRKAAAAAAEAAADALSKAQAEAAERARSAPDAVDIVCNGRSAQLLVRETAVIMENGNRVSPTEFERLSGKGAAKKWKVR